MYKEHDSFIQPDDVNIKVWRYTSFTKLVSLLDSRSLYFTRSDKFDDPFEGSLTKHALEERKFTKEEIIRQIGPEASKRVLASMEGEEERNMNWRHYHALNCWHMSEHESAAMWGLYTMKDGGIAIQSTYAKLRESFIGDDRMFLGVVRYIDYESEAPLDRNMLSPYMHKRKSFEHEQEVRALIPRWPIVKGKGLDFTIETIEHGILSPVILETLIEHIFVAPSSPTWFSDLVISVCSAYGYKFNITQSKLDAKPIF